jgi:hypothetical protein
VPDKTTDLEHYEDKLISNLKTISLEVSNILINKSMQNESSVQLMKTLGIAIDKLRLIEGKSTHNIASQIVHNLNPEQLKQLEALGESLIKSMLTE